MVGIHEHVHQYGRQVDQAVLEGDKSYLNGRCGLLGSHGGGRSAGQMSWE